MPKITVSIDGVMVKEVPLIKDRTTIGRRPYNDIVIDNLAVSGEHAVMQMSGSEVFLEDLNSTNGTHVNGTTIKKQALKNGDSIGIAKYTITFSGRSTAVRAEKTSAMSLGGVAATSQTWNNAAIKVMTGSAAGYEVPLIKVVTTVGKPGIAVAAITHRSTDYVIGLIEGVVKPLINGRVLGDDAVSLTHGDVIELAGIQMQFIQR